MKDIIDYAMHGTKLQHQFTIINCKTS